MENINNNTETEEINIKEILFKYFAFWRWFVIGVILSLFVAFTYLRYASDIYQTTAKIKILDNSKGGMKLPSDVAALFSNTKVNLDNEIEVSVEIKEFSFTIIKIYQEIKIDKKILSTLNVDLACINLQKLKPHKISQNLKDLLNV